MAVTVNSAIDILKTRVSLDLGLGGTIVGLSSMGGLRSLQVCGRG